MKATLLPTWGQREKGGEEDKIMVPSLPLPRPWAGLSVRRLTQLLLLT